MEPQETADPQEALTEVWRWLSAGGPHFPGGWTLNADDKKKTTRASLQMKGLPKDMRRAVMGVIRKAALDVGWRAKHVRFLVDRVEFELKPYPLEKRLLEEAKREEFRQAARRKREGTPPGRGGSQTPAP